MGSPPPTRGTLILSSALAGVVRITPAYAGNTTFVTIYKFRFRDHPRLRGEHSFTSGVIINRVGSPPPTRGTQNDKFIKHNETGITPAYAGNTGYRARSNKAKKDHPRLRGEH